MTEAQVISWMQESVEDGPKYEYTALGFIMADIDEFGFDGWLMLDHETIIDSFLETTDAVSSALLSDYRTIISQEQDLEELGIEQSLKLNTSGLIEALNDGLLDVFRSMRHYFHLQTQAKFYYNAH